MKTRKVIRLNVENVKKTYSRCPRPMAAPALPWSRTGLEVVHSCSISPVNYALDIVFFHSSSYILSLSKIYNFVKLS